MFRKLGIAALVLTLATAAQAQSKSAERQIRDQLRAQGFSQIEIERDDGKIEVEARRAGQKIELKYDARTGRLISQKVSRMDGRDGVRRATTGSRWDGRRVSRDDDDDDGNRRSTRRDDDDDDAGRRGGSRGGSGGGGRDDNDDDD